jgi:hypothetical protein
VIAAEPDRRAVNGPTRARRTAPALSAVVAQLSRPVAVARIGVAQSRLERAAAFFVAPAAPAASGEAAVAPPAARAVVLGSSDDVVPLAAAVALGLRPPGLVAVWNAGRTPAAGVATRAAARLAARLAARDLPAVARGRLAWLTLPADASEADAAVRRAAAAVDGPLVTALAGPRPPELEDLVAEYDIAIVAADPAGPLARTALARLAARGIDARACRPLRRGLPRTIALAGLAASKELA